MTYSRLLVLGAGYTGARILRAGRARGLTVSGTVRSRQSADALRAEGFDVHVASEIETGLAALVDRDTHVVVAFPTEDRCDARIAPLLRGAHSIVYISSTGVYGERRGRIDDETALPEAPDERAQRILFAEEQYRAVAACVLRSPGIYGPDRGLHMRVLSGTYRMPGDGSRTLSRIHADDLAQFALAASHIAGETFVVGDRLPAQHVEVVRFICESYRVAMPGTVPIDSVHASLRADRSVDASRALERLAVGLRYASYREGMAPGATGIAPRA